MDYLLSYRWKKKPKVSIKECREDILQIQTNEFFDYQQIVAQTSNLKMNDWHDIEDLF